MIVQKCWLTLFYTLNDIFVSPKNNRNYSPKKSLVLTASKYEYLGRFRPSEQIFSRYEPLGGPDLFRKCGNLSLFIVFFELCLVGTFRQSFKKSFSPLIIFNICQDAISITSRLCYCVDVKQLPPSLVNTILGNINQQILHLNVLKLLRI